MGIEGISDQEFTVRAEGVLKRIGVDPDKLIAEVREGLLSNANLGEILSKIPNKGGHQTHLKKEFDRLKLYSENE
ncbi:hypothetical protein KKD70_04895 [Patescibacteria group bacterium]|nr:hypothetical protein [Patescibacteria group bacterium]